MSTKTGGSSIPVVVRRLISRLRFPAEVASKERGTSCALGLAQLLGAPEPFAVPVEALDPRMPEPGLTVSPGVVDALHSTSGEPTETFFIPSVTVALRPTWTFVPPLGEENPTAGS